MASPMPNPMPNPPAYSRLQIVLHWLVFVLIAAQFVLHDGIKAAWEAIEDGTPAPEFDPTVPLHVFGGLAVLALVVWRLVLRARRGVPPAPAAMGAGLKRLSGAAHLALYAVTAAMVLTGGAAWFGGIEAAAEVHETLRVALLALIGLHVAAALWHQFWLRDNLMARMR